MISVELNWHTFACSVRGASHLRAGTPNQDSANAEPERGQSKCAIVSVADGHGSAEYLRSQIGSKFAVNATIEVLTRYIFAAYQPILTDEHKDLRVFRQLAVERIPREIDKLWRATVEEHLLRHPLAEEEKRKLDGLVATARDHIQSEVSLYGTTVLGVMTTKDYIIYLQNGDGDILVLYEDGAVHRTLSPDSRLFANETTSMAADHSWRDFRIKFEPTGTKPPLLIMASTDGYVNSFGTDEDFLQVPRDLFKTIGERGEDWTLAQIPRWLAETSAEGSNDDISVGLIWRDGSLRQDTDALMSGEAAGEAAGQATGEAESSFLANGE